MFVLGAIATATLVMAAGEAGAVITTPGNGSVVRGNVTIHENSGGQDNCVFGSSGDNTRIEVRNSGNAVVVSASKNDGGSYTITWGTVNAFPNGNYRIISFGRNITNGFFRCNTGGEYVISDYTVSLQNRSFISYTGSTSGLSQSSVPVSATVSLEDGAGNVGGRTVVFSLSGQPNTVSAVTNGAGVASASLPITRGAGGATVTASYAGDSFFLQSSSSTGFTVATRPTTLTYLGDTNGYWTENATLRVRLNDVATGGGVAGKTIAFSLGSANVSATTDGAGVATAVVPLNDAPSSYTAAASFGGDSVYAGSATSAGFAVLHRPTTLTYVGDAEGYWDENATLSARLTDSRSGAALAGKTVSFALGSASGSAVTDGDGVATISSLLADPAGPYTAASSFSGDSHYVSSSDADAFDILLRPTTLTYGGDLSGFWTETASVSATLTDNRRGTGVAGKTVTFALGSESTSAVTDANGVASATLPLSDTPGAFTAASAFAGDQFYVASNDDDAFEILKRPTSLTYTGATQGFRGHTVTMSATLLDTRGDAGLQGKTVHFTLGSFSADATTDSSGHASVNVLLNQDPGSYTADVSFDEDANYLGSSDSDAFTLDWEYVFNSALGSEGTVNINVSTREWQFVSGADNSGIVSDPGMVVLKAPDGFEPPAAPCDVNDPSSCGVEPPAAPCDPNAPESCVPDLPEPPCDPNAPEGCVPPTPQVPECLDDPTGGDPVCPGDYVPVVQAGAAADPVCVDNPLGGDPICLPEAPPAPEPPCDLNDPSTCGVPEAPEPPCDVNDPSTCGVPEVPEAPEAPCETGESCAQLVACSLPLATGCSDRFVILAFSGPAASSGGITIAGVFDLQTGVFAAVTATDAGQYALASLADNNPEPPAAPCDPNAPEGCVPPPPPPPCDTNDPSTCGVPTPPPAPCDPALPEGCVPTPPPAPCDPAVDPTACLPPSPQVRA